MACSVAQSALSDAISLAFNAVSATSGPWSIHLAPQLSNHFVASISVAMTANLCWMAWKSLTFFEPIRCSLTKEVEASVAAQVNPVSLAATPTRFSFKDHSSTG